MESASKQQLLKRIAALVSENKELKEKQRALTEAYHQLSGELEQYREWIEKAKADPQGDTGKPTHQPTRFDMVTILFVEIQGLSDIITADNTSGYMDKLDDFVLHFNEIVEKYRLVKLHSIGDRFICAGGIPEKDATNPITVTRAALETMAIVAYKQPITRLEIDEVRGVDSSYSIQILVDNNLIEVIGRKDTLGKPLLYGTTDEFLKRFELTDINHLPSYEELLDKIKVIQTNFDGNLYNSNRGAEQNFEEEIAVDLREVKL